MRVANRTAQPGDFSVLGRGLRLFATLWPTCPFNTSFKQLLQAGEPGFGAPVVHGTPEARMALSLPCHWHRCHLLN
ncbi:MULTISPECIES: hypothetical protein [unclassified Polaromonas]|uniref:hypothetical protein n=1 Tax=unclassified Polaromonas TaxID=2638319 RepID=UPI0018CA75C3|nr:MULTISPECIES: hypothetical protein [unclassified Polaromonas]MBG6073933.1 hypothetical protein [Polaromonas sp. CG_9.7]MDH6183547.1 hypothetical protein [Polaromonas sp. CG_23.6]